MQIEQAVANAIPHTEECIAARTTGLAACDCSANKERAKLLMHIQSHVDRKTMGRVYLDRN